MRKTGHGNRNGKKNLSWIYRKKVKLQRANRPKESTDDNEPDNSRARIIIRNLPFKVTEDDVKKLYGPFGHIEEINLLKHPDGKLVGCGFIQFKRMEDASKAIFNTNKTEFLGRVINSSWAISKSKFCKKLEKASAENADNVDEEIPNTNSSQVQDGKDKPQSQKMIKRKQKQRKTQKEKNRKKRARLIIRNLSFQATEESIKEYFSRFGTIEDVEILRKNDGKNVGCAFVQFDRVQSAAKAVHHTNLKPLLDRPITVDWAISKSSFLKNNKQDTKDGIVEIKTEKEDDAGTSDMKKETESNNDSANESNLNEDSGSQEETESVCMEESDEEDSSATLEENIKTLKEEDEVDLSNEEELLGIKDEEIKNEQDEKRPRRESHDISEGKTVFLKNVPFSVKNEELKSFMERFGPVFYALVCMDPLTEYSKSTAFVKFRNVEDAEKCLSAGSELEIEGQVLEAHKALERNEVENKANLKQTKIKDSRNLYLVKEGVVMAGSTAAAGVSATDMAKRLQVEKWKSQILRNLNMFVSRTRLVVHNLPPSLDDEKLRKIFELHSSSNVVIREARVMRDLKNVDSKGLGKSKEYAFVSFTNHEDALKALRTINNNPKVFSTHRRPIVSFSIENRILVNAKQRRIEKSRQHNPLWPGNSTKRKNKDNSEKVPMKKLKNDETKEANIETYSGSVGMPGKNKLKSKFNLKSQAIVHHETMKKEKKKNKVAKKLQMQRKEQEKSKKEIKPKQGAKVNVNDVKLDNLVDSYKNKLKSIEIRKSKWYDS